MLQRRSVSIDGARTTVRLDEEFWQTLEEFAAADDSTSELLITQILAGIKPGRRAAALRVYTLRRLTSAN